jgi:hypothetical protein
MQAGSIHRCVPLRRASGEHTYIRITLFVGLSASLFASRVAALEHLRYRELSRTVPIDASKKSLWQV